MSPATRTRILYYHSRRLSPDVEAAMPILLGAMESEPSLRFEVEKVQHDAYRVTVRTKAHHDEAEWLRILDIIFDGSPSES